MWVEEYIIYYVFSSLLWFNTLTAERKLKDAVIEHEKSLRMHDKRLEMCKNDIEALMEDKKGLMDQPMDMLKANAIIDLVRKLAKVYKADILDGSLALSELFSCDV